MPGSKKPVVNRVAAMLGGTLLLLAAGQDSRGDTAEPRVKIDDNSFKCITQMTKVRHFYVDNLSGNLAETVAVATAGTGDYPEGSVVQLMPNEVMIKQQKGFSPVTATGSFSGSTSTRTARRSTRADSPRSTTASA